MTPFEKLILRGMKIWLASLWGGLDRWDKEEMVSLMGDIQRTLNDSDEQEKQRNLTRY